MAVVSLSISEKIAVLTIDNPPVNMGNAELRRDLLAAVAEMAATPGLAGMVIASAGKHFYAGSDISEFDRPLEEPQLPSVIEAIEALDIPVVAAINGLALGGGLELALGCDARIGDTTAVIGFPEVDLGMLPGAGGTVRAVRLLGVPRAIELIASARQIDANAALELGFLDQVVGVGELLTAARSLVLTLNSKNLIRDRVVPASTPEQIADATKTATKSGKARPNIIAAVDLATRSEWMSARDALIEERALFHHFRQSKESANLRYLFFAKRAAAKSARFAGGGAKVKTIGIAGAGTMGLTLARACVEAGYSVTVFDTSEPALARLAANHPEITTTAELAGLAESDLVIDAVFEDMAVKRQLFAGLETIVSESAILATNTSYLSLEEMSDGMKHPERFAGLHFFNPADKNPLVELIRGSSTTDVTMATLGAVAARLRKVAILAGQGDGFVANRVYSDYRAQAEFLVEEGASPESVDAAMVVLGMAIGPFAVSDMSGLDIALARRTRQAATRDPKQRYVTIADTLCSEGRLGKKSGAGWFAYPEGARRGVPDPRTAHIIEEARSVKGIVAREIDNDEIQLRILCSMLCAAAVLLESGIAQRASDIDVAMTEGFAFPRWTGGPLRLLSDEPSERIIEGLAAVYTSCPVTFLVAAEALDGVMPPAIARVLDAVAPVRVALALK